MNRVAQFKSPRLDMNPMVDMAFLLVTFFMLTTTFKLPQPLLVDTPLSSAKVKLPERDVLILSVGDDGRVFMDLDGKFTRQRLLVRMGERYGVHFSREEREAFGIMTGYGVPIEQLSTLISMSQEERQLLHQPGIPLDSAHNQVAEWLTQARLVNPGLRIAIRADRDVPYSRISGLINTLLDQNITRFNLITEQRIEEISAAP